MQTIEGVHADKNSENRHEAMAQDEPRRNRKVRHRAMTRIAGLVAASVALLVGMTAPAQAWGYKDWQYIRCNSGLYVSIHTRTTQDVTVQMSTYGQKRSGWGENWKSNTFNTRLSYGSWRAWTSGRMDHANTYAYCSPY